MIDVRHETFLALCEILSYTKTAEFLHITQPAVSQHIKYLEEVYNGKLFMREGKQLKLTNRGRLLFRFAKTMHADANRLQKLVCDIDQDEQKITFGATLSIGEYMMPPILSSLMHTYEHVQLNMLVENTQSLLAKLEKGVIDFACIEGFFDKTRYEWRLFSEERFIGVCSVDSPLCNKPLSMESLFKQRLILREKGSGTREIFEQILWQNNLRLENFKQRCEVGNMQTIKELVAQNRGITFLYQAAAEKELASGSLAMMDLKDFSVMRAFHFVCLKNSMHKDEYLGWFERILFARGASKSNA